MLFRFLVFTIKFIIILGFIYLVANIFRYFFFRKNVGNSKGFFALSDMWIKNSKN
jgi:hypothetical protein